MFFLRYRRKFRPSLPVEILLRHFEYFVGGKRKEKIRRDAHRRKEYEQRPYSYFIDNKRQIHARQKTRQKQHEIRFQNKKRKHYDTAYNALLFVEIIEFPQKKREYRIGRKENSRQNKSVAKPTRDKKCYGERHYRRNKPPRSHRAEGNIHCRRIKYERHYIDRRICAHNDGHRRQRRANRRIGNATRVHIVNDSSMTTCRSTCWQDSTSYSSCLAHFRGICRRCRFASAGAPCRYRRPTANGRFSGRLFRCP